MKNFLYKLKYASVILAACGIVGFWILGYTGHIDMASYSLVIAGLLAWIYLFTVILTRKPRY